MYRQSMTKNKKQITHQGDALTADEINVLRHIALSGEPYKEIARFLGISTTNIGATLYIISRKTGVKRRHGLTVWAFQAGIVNVHDIKV